MKKGIEKDWKKIRKMFTGLSLGARYQVMFKILQYFVLHLWWIEGRKVERKEI